MSYQGISIREVLDKINANTNGWYLPEVQRQYVWGNRNNSEDYVCLLLDSLLQGYPIGGIVVWENNQKIPFRPFLTDYTPNKFNNLVDDGRWSENKSLVYDGQQRLQTLYSVLRHTFNGRVLHYDLSFDPKKADTDETGFFFLKKGEEADVHCIKMTELCSKASNDESSRVKLELKLGELYKDDIDKLILSRANLNKLWDAFVKKDKNPIAFFSVSADNADIANEVFRRLNIGGVSLTSSELVLGKIKAKYYDFEQELWNISDEIKNTTGIRFSSEQLLQLIYLLVKNTIRVDDRYFLDKDIELFNNKLKTIREPVLEFFKYLRNSFNINHSSIIPRWWAILPMIVYLIKFKEVNSKYTWLNKDAKYMQYINQYFLHSQILDWNTQTMVNKFAELAIKAAESKEDFPLKEIKGFAVQKNRVGELNEDNFTWKPLFALKMLQPQRTFNFSDNKPQIDHIFPLKRGKADELYQNEVDVLWNFQILTAELNNYKRDKSPKEFLLEHPDMIGSFDFIPTLENEAWDTHTSFIEYRKEKMIKFLNTQYSVTFSKIE